MVELIIFSLINGLSTGFEPLRGAFTFRPITFTDSNVLYAKYVDYILLHFKQAIAR